MKISKRETKVLRNIRSQLECAIVSSDLIRKISLESILKDMGYEYDFIRSGWCNLIYFTKNGERIDLGDD